MQPHDCLCDVDVGVGNVQNNIYDSHSNSLQQKRTEHFQLVKYFELKNTKIQWHSDGEESTTHRIE